MNRHGLLLSGLLAGLFLIVSLEAAQARVVETFRVGAWSGNAYVDDTTNAFVSCTASARYRSNITLSVQVDGNYSWALGFGSDAWTMTVGQDIPLSYRIDRGAWQQGLGRVAYSNMVRMEMPANGYIIRRFRRGRLMQVHDGQRSYEFRLTGTSRLMARLAKCVERNSFVRGSGPGLGAPSPRRSAPSVGGGAPAPGGQPATPSAPQPTANDTAAFKVEATQVLFNLMGNAGITGAKISKENEIPEELKGAHALAQATGRMILVQIVPEGGYTSEQQLISSMIGSAAAKCQGSFQSGSEAVTVDGRQMHTGFSRCEAGDVEEHERYVLTGRTAGGLYMIGVGDTYVGEGGGEPSEPAQVIEDSTLYRAAAQAGD